jgi:hypothetical protein
VTVGKVFLAHSSALSWLDCERYFPSRNFPLKASILPRIPPPSLCFGSASEISRFTKLIQRNQRSQARPQAESQSLDGRYRRTRDGPSCLSEHFSGLQSFCWLPGESILHQFEYTPQANLKQPANRVQPVILRRHSNLNRMRLPLRHRALAAWVHHSHATCRRRYKRRGASSGCWPGGVVGAARAVAEMRLVGQR